jgi:hypothetical protein
MMDDERANKAKEMVERAKDVAAMSKSEFVAEINKEALQEKLEAAEQRRLARTYPSNVTGVEAGRREKIQGQGNRRPCQRCGGTQQKVGG